MSTKCDPYCPTFVLFDGWKPTSGNGVIDVHAVCKIAHDLAMEVDGKTPLRIIVFPTRRHRPRPCCHLPNVVVVEDPDPRGRAIALAEELVTAQHCGLRIFDHLIIVTDDIMRHSGVAARMHRTRGSLCIRKIT